MLNELEALSYADTSQAFAHELVRVAGRLVPGELLGVFMKSPDGRVQSHAFNEFFLTLEELQGVGRIWTTHPIQKRYLEGMKPGVQRLSDFASDRQWREHPMFRDFLRVPSYHRHLSIPLQFDQVVTGVLSIDRSGPDYTERDVALVKAFRPMVSGLWNSLMEKENLRADLVRIAAGSGAAGVDRHARLRALGVTRRETEVLEWMIEGKQNREIAMILGLSLRTVQKHVENMLVRLHIENRHALTIHAMRWLDAI